MIHLKVNTRMEATTIKRIEGSRIMIPIMTIGARIMELRETTAVGETTTKWTRTPPLT